MHSQAIGRRSNGARATNAPFRSPTLPKETDPSRQVSPCALGQIENPRGFASKSNPTTKCASSWAMVPGSDSKAMRHMELRTARSSATKISTNATLGTKPAWERYERRYSMRSLCNTPGQIAMSREPLHAIVDAGKNCHDATNCQTAERRVRRLTVQLRPLTTLSSHWTYSEADGQRTKPAGLTGGSTSPNA